MAVRSLEEREEAELRELVEAFYEGGEEVVDRVSGFRSGTGRFREMLDLVLTGSREGSAAEVLRVEVEDAVRVIGSGADGLKRRVVCWLRERGVDAGLCKSQWERAHRIPAGHHEYIDVIAKNKKRYIVEINLAGEFEIARPTAEHVTLLNCLPKVFVGRPEILMNVVKIMCAAAKDSMKSAGMHIPPWRTKEYMLQKWSVSQDRSASKICAELKESNAKLAVTVTGGAAASSGSVNRKDCRSELARREGQGGQKFTLTSRGSIILELP